MWGSASADRSLIETQDTVLWLRLHLGGDASRLGLGCWTAVHPALSGSGRESPTCFGRPCTPGPDVPGGFGRIGALSHTERADLLRQEPTLRRVPEPLRRSWGFASRPPVPASVGSAAGGHEAPASRSTHRPLRWTASRSTGSASTRFGERRFRTGFGRCGRYSRGFRRPRPPATVTPVTARPRENSTASAAGGPLPPFFLGRRAAGLEDGRKRQGGNDRRNAERLLTRGTLRRVIRGAGNGRFAPTSKETVGRAPGNATDPIAGSGAQQTRSADAEQAAEGVRNPEGGTGFDGSHRRTEGSASFRECTHRRSNGRGAQSGRIPREEELGPLRRSRGVPAETRAL
jgi:hypothetical protein